MTHTKKATMEPDSQRLGAKIAKKVSVDETGRRIWESSSVMSYVYFQKVSCSSGVSLWIITTYEGESSSVVNASLP